jgi:hypothetical protein
MKKLLSLILLLLTTLLVNAQVKCLGCYIEMLNKNANGMTWENDSLKFTFVPDSYFWEVNIENKTNTTAICDWDKTLFIVNKISSNIMFGTSTPLTMNQPKGTSSIGASSIIKSPQIAPIVDYHGEEDLRHIFHKSDVKREGGSMPIRLIFPIAFNGKSKEYIFEFRVFVPQKKE